VRDDDGGLPPIHSSDGTESHSSEDNASFSIGRRRRWKSDTSDLELLISNVVDLA
jgi:hypothetical protein